MLTNRTNHMTVEEINAINILANLSPIKKLESKEQTMYTRSTTLGRLYSNIPKLQKELEIIKSVINNKFSEAELHEIFSTNFLAGRTMFFYFEWITKSREERIDPRRRLRGYQVVRW